MKQEQERLQSNTKEKSGNIRSNQEKIKQNKVLPYLVGNVVEVSSKFLLEA